MNLEGSAYECAWEDGYDEGFDAGELASAPQVTALQQENQDLCDALMQSRDQVHVLETKVAFLERTTASYVEDALKYRDLCDG